MNEPSSSAAGMLAAEAPSAETAAVAQLDGLQLIAAGAASRSLVFRGTSGGRRVCVKYSAAREAEGLAAPAAAGLLGPVLIHPHVIRTFGWHITRLTDADFQESSKLAAEAGTAAGAGAGAGAAGAGASTGAAQPDIEGRLRQPQQLLPHEPQRQQQQPSAGDAEEARSAPPLRGRRGRGLLAALCFCLEPSQLPDQEQEAEANTRRLPAAAAAAAAAVHRDDANSHDGGSGIGSGEGGAPELDGCPPAALEAGWGRLRAILRRLDARPGDYLTRIVMEDADLGSLAGAIRNTTAATAATGGAAAPAGAAPSGSVGATVGGGGSVGGGGGGGGVSVGMVRRSATGGAAGMAPGTPRSSFSMALMQMSSASFQLPHSHSQQPSRALPGPLFCGDADGGEGLQWLLMTALDIAAGMLHLHSHQVIHGDLKPGNVLLVSDPHDVRGFVAKITDFGLSRLVGHEPSLDNHDLYGTVRYMAPEVIDGRSCKSSDVWSYGVVVWQMVTGEVPWPGLRSMQVMMGVLHGELRLSLPPRTHPRLAALLEACLDHDHSRRPGFDEVAWQLQEMLLMHDVAVLGPGPPLSLPAEELPGEAGGEGAGFTTATTAATATAAATALGGRAPHEIAATDETGADATSVEAGARGPMPPLPPAPPHLRPPASAPRDSPLLHLAPAAPPVPSLQASGAGGAAAASHSTLDVDAEAAGGVPGSTAVPTAATGTGNLVSAASASAYIGGAGGISAASTPISSAAPPGAAGTASIHAAIRGGAIQTGPVSADAAAAPPPRLSTALDASTPGMASAASAAAAARGARSCIHAYQGQTASSVAGEGSLSSGLYAFVNMFARELAPLPPPATTTATAATAATTAGDAAAEERLRSLAASAARGARGFGEGPAPPSGSYAMDAALSVPHSSGPGSRRASAHGAARPRTDTGVTAVAGSAAGADVTAASQLVTAAGGRGRGARGLLFVDSVRGGGGGGGSEGRSQPFFLSGASAFLDVLRSPSRSRRGGAGGAGPAAAGSPARTGSASGAPGGISVAAAAAAAASSPSTGPSSNNTAAPAAPALAPTASASAAGTGAMAGSVAELLRHAVRASPLQPLPQRRTHPSLPPAAAAAATGRTSRDVPPHPVLRDLYPQPHPAPADGSGAVAVDGSSATASLTWDSLSPSLLAAYLPQPQPHPHTNQHPLQPFAAAAMRPPSGAAFPAYMGASAASLAAAGGGGGGGRATSDMDTSAVRLMLASSERDSAFAALATAGPRAGQSPLFPLSRVREDGGAAAGGGAPAVRAATSAFGGAGSGILSTAGSGAMPPAAAAASGSASGWTGTPAGGAAAGAGRPVGPPSLGLRLASGSSSSTCAAIIPSTSVATLQTAPSYASTSSATIARAGSSTPAVGGAAASATSAPGTGGGPNSSGALSSTVSSSSVLGPQRSTAGSSSLGRPYFPGPRRQQSWGLSAWTTGAGGAGAGGFTGGVGVGGGSGWMMGSTLSNVQPAAALPGAPSGTADRISGGGTLGTYGGGTWTHGARTRGTFDRSHSALGASGAGRGSWELAPQPYGGISVGVGAGVRVGVATVSPYALMCESPLAPGGPGAMSAGAGASAGAGGSGTADGTSSQRWLRQPLSYHIVPQPPLLRAPAPPPQALQQHSYQLQQQAQYGRRSGSGRSWDPPLPHSSSSARPTPSGSLLMSPTAAATGGGMSGGAATAGTRTGTGTGTGVDGSGSASGWADAEVPLELLDWRAVQEKFKRELSVVRPPPLEPLRTTGPGQQHPQQRQDGQGGGMGTVRSVLGPAGGATSTAGTATASSDGGGGGAGGLSPQTSLEPPYTLGGFMAMPSTSMDSDQRTSAFLSAGGGGGGGAGGPAACGSNSSGSLRHSSFWSSQLSHSQLLASSSHALQQQHQQQQQQQQQQASASLQQLPASLLVIGNLPLPLQAGGGVLLPIREERPASASAGSNSRETSDSRTHSHSQIYPASLGGGSRGSSTMGLVAASAAVAAGATASGHFPLRRGGRRYSASAAVVAGVAGSAGGGIGGGGGGGGGGGAVDSGGLTSGGGVGSAVEVMSLDAEGLLIAAPLPGGSGSRSRSGSGSGSRSRSGSGAGGTGSGSRGFGNSSGASQMSGSGGVGVLGGTVRDPHRRVLAVTLQQQHSQQHPPGGHAHRTPAAGHAAQHSAAAAGPIAVAAAAVPAAAGAGAQQSGLTGAEQAHSVAMAPAAVAAATTTAGLDSAAFPDYELLFDRLPAWLGPLPPVQAQPVMATTGGGIAVAAPAPSMSVRTTAPGPHPGTAAAAGVLDAAGRQSPVDASDEERTRKS